MVILPTKMCVFSSSLNLDFSETLGDPTFEGGNPCESHASGCSISERTLGGIGREVQWRSPEVSAEMVENNMVN